MRDCTPPWNASIMRIVARTPRPLTAVLILAALVLAGCSSQPAAHTADATHLTVGTTVTRAEYTGIFDTWAACMQKAGAVFSMPQAQWNPTSNQELIRAWNTTQPTITPAARAACQKQYDPIKREFQKQTAPRTDPQLMSYVIDCIARKGGPSDLTPADDLHALSLEAPEIADTNPDSPIPSCVSDGVASLYPGLQGYSLAF